MGKGFGNLAHIRNVIYVTLSPYEQKAFANFFKNSMRGLKRDFIANAPYWTPGLLAVYFIRNWANATYERSLRKNPEDYANDV